MREIADQESPAFTRDHKEAVINRNPVDVVYSSQIEHMESNEFALEKTTVRSFQNARKSAAHRANYRGNWAPEIARNLILRYTEPARARLESNEPSITTKN